MPDARIRRYDRQDIEPFTRLFNAVNGIAGTEKAYDVELMDQVLSQPSCNPTENCYLVEVEDSLAGYTIVSPETPIGRAVAAGGVLEGYRRRGIGRRLVRTAIERAERLNVSVLDIEAPFGDTDIHRILESEGFHPSRRYWNMRWEGGDLPTVESPNGFSVRPFRLNQDEAALTELQNAAFEQNWGFCPNTVDEIGARVRFKRCRPEGIILVAGAAGLAAYNWTARAADDTRAVGWVAMTGVHPEYRRMGLGRLAVVEGMKYLITTGVDGIELQVDSENPPARELYLSLGFERTSETIWYGKPFGR